MSSTVAFPAFAQETTSSHLKKFFEILRHQLSPFGLFRALAATSEKGGRAKEGHEGENRLRAIPRHGASGESHECQCIRV